MILLKNLITMIIYNRIVVDETAHVLLLGFELIIPMCRE